MDKYVVERAILRDILIENIKLLNYTIHRMVNVFVFNAKKDSIRSGIYGSILVKIINLFSFMKQKFTDTGL